MSFKINTIAGASNLTKRIRFEGFLTLLLAFSLAVHTPAFAEGGGGGGGGATCPSCGAPAHGGPGGGGGGQQAAAILAALAAVVAPIVAAIAMVESEKAQAEADITIAEISAESAMAQTSMQAEVTLSLASQQAAVAEQNTAATMELAQRQQQASTQRLHAQIQAGEQARQEEQQERAIIRSLEQQRSDQQIAFAREQSALQLQMAQQAVNQSAQAQSLAVVPGTTGGLTTNQYASSGAYTGSKVPNASVNYNSSRAVTASKGRGVSGPRNALNVKAPPTVVQAGTGGMVSRGIASLSSKKMLSNAKNGRGFTVSNKAVVSNNFSMKNNFNSRLLAAVQNSKRIRTKPSSNFSFSRKGKKPRKANPRFQGSRYSKQTLRGVVKTNYSLIRGSVRGAHNSSQTDLVKFTHAVRAAAARNGTATRHSFKKYRSRGAKHNRPNEGGHRRR